MDRLTERQKRFCQAYAKSGNASEAARQAGYKGPAHVIGAQNLAKDSIQAELARLGGMAKAVEPLAVLDLAAKRRILAEIASDSRNSPIARVQAILADYKISGGDKEEEKPMDLIAWIKDTVERAGGPRAYAAYRQRYLERLAQDNPDQPSTSGDAYPVDTR